MTGRPGDLSSARRSTTTPVARRHAGGGRRKPVGQAPVTATGHHVGRTYYSLSHLVRYHVVGVATTWELAPGQCVQLRWENGNCTTSATPRGRDPEVCRACDGLVTGPPWPALGRCACGAAGGPVAPAVARTA